MITPLSDSLTDAAENKPATVPRRIPRKDSLLHQLQHAKDADRQPIPLLDELFLLLDDPPRDIGDRWQAGADLCQSHAIATSRMSVWRLYRAHVLQWRREQYPASTTAPAPEETARLHEQVSHLAAQRALDALQDPGLSPGHLVGLLQNDNQRRQLDLARDQFKDRVKFRDAIENFEFRQRLEKRIREEAQYPDQLKSYRKFFEALLSANHQVTPHTTS